MPQTQLPHAPFAFKAPAAAALLAAALGLAGCYNPLNEGLSIGGELYPPALIPADRLYDPTDPLINAPVVTPPPEESVVGVLRENWREMVILVPASTVEHRATSAVHPLWVRNGSWLPDEYPTQETVIAVPSFQRNLTQAHEGFWAPIFAGLDLVMAVPRAMREHPWVVQTSPRDAYHRMPRRLPRVVPFGELPEDQVLPEPPPPAAPAPRPPAAPPEITPAPAQPTRPGGGVPEGPR